MLRANNKTFIALTDADGCIYNENYMHLLLHIITKYHRILHLYGQDRVAYQKDKISADIQITNMIKEIESLVTYQEDDIVRLQDVQTQNELIISLLKDHGYPNIEKLDVEDIQAIMFDTQIRYMNYINNFGEMGQQLLNALMLAANKPFLHEIKQRMLSGHFNKFILMCGSNRQSKPLDDLNSRENATSSFMVTLSVLFDKIKTSFASGENQIESILDQFLMADIYGNHKPGTSFQLIQEEYLQNLQGNMCKLQHSDYIFDKQKFSLLYAVFHYISQKLPEDEITLAFFDDMEDIYLALMKTFHDHPDLLPKNITLECWPYCGNLPQNKSFQSSDVDSIQDGYIYTLRGTGDVDKNFAENVFKMAALSGYDVEDKPSINPITDMDIETFKRERMPVKIETLSSAFANKLTLFGGSEVIQLPATQSSATSALVVDKKNQNDVSTLGMS